MHSETNHRFLTHANFYGMKYDLLRLYSEDSHMYLDDNHFTPLRFFKNVKVSDQMLEWEKNVKVRV